MSIARAVEALLLMATEPVRATDLATQLGVPEREVIEELEQLARFYQDTERGFELRRVAGGWRLATSPDLAEVLEAAVVAETRARLSQAALETLAVIAYLQPVTRGRVSGVRGVSVDGVVRTLLAHGLITEAGERLDVEVSGILSSDVDDRLRRACDTHEPFTIHWYPPMGPVLKIREG